MGCVVMFAPLMHAKCEARAVNGHGQLLQNVGQRAYMVLVAVREENSLYFLQVVLKVSYIGHYEVYAKHIVIRKAQAAIYYYNIIAVFKRGYIFAYFAKTAEGYYAKLFEFCFSH